MTDHAPKIAALEAYRAGALSARGAARVARHLERCGECRRALATMEAYDASLEVARAAATPTIDFGRMELALAREARAQSRARTWRRAAPVALFAAAAAVLLAFFAGGRPTEVAAPTPAPPIAIPSALPDEPALVVATVSLAAGSPRVRRGRDEDASPPIAVGDVVAEGDVLLTGALAAVRVAFADTLAVGVGPDAEARLERSRDDEVRVSLARGEAELRAVAPDEVAPDQDGASDGVVVRTSRVVMLAGGYRASARAAAFRMTMVDTLSLEVSEGEVVLEAPDGRVETLVAPARWPADDDDDSIAIPSLVGAGAPLLTVRREGIVRWEIGDVASVGADGIALRAAPGSITIAGFDAQDRAFRTVVVLGADGLDVAGDALVAEPPRLRTGFLPEEDIRRVVARGLPGLRRCYEAGLRLRPDLEGTIRARITVALDGSVRRIAILDDDVPAPLRECVTLQAGRWVFPTPTGGPVTFEAPLAFASR